MTVLVTGANGQLGNELRLVASGLAPNFLFSDITEASPESIAMLQRLGGDGVYFMTLPLDITDLDAVRRVVRTQGVDVVVNCAAFTNVDAAESQPELAEALNATAVENLAVAMKEVGGLLVHISTDYVFGARAYVAPIREEEPGAPTGVYGLTKLHGEEAIRRIGCRHVIIRTGWMYSEFGKNFVRTMLHLTSTRPQIKVVNDQRGTPTYARDLAEAIVTILSAIDTPSPLFADPSESLLGTYNYSNAGECTWYDFACAIAEMAGHSACTILPCRSDEFPSPVRRPSYSVLDKTKIQATFGLALPAWPDSLRNCLENIL